MRILFFVALSLTLFKTSYSQSLKVMTYNIRLNLSSDSVNAWPNRREKVFELIKKNSPDAFGVQEAVPGQMQDLVNALSDYSFVGVGREDGKDKGEYTAIFYKKSRLKVVKNDSFWLSETPHVPGSIGWDAAITRIVTWAQFEDLQTKQEFLLLTTHFDHVGKVARVNSAMAIKNRIAQTLAIQEMPVVVCGDFNFQPEEEPYGKLVSCTEPLLLDARTAEDKRGTFCGFEKDKMNCLIIDYIFHSPQWHVKSFEVLQDNDGTYYPSDHLPVIATMVLTH